VRATIPLLVCAAACAPTPAEQTRSLSVDAPLDFGRVTSGTAQTLLMRVRNAGTANVELLDAAIAPPNPSFSLTFTPVTLAAGVWTGVPVTFTARDGDLQLAWVHRDDRIVELERAELRVHQATVSGWAGEEHPVLALDRRPRGGLERAIEREAHQAAPVERGVTRHRSHREAHLLTRDDRGGEGVEASLSPQASCC
jgi:hypothetical protein